MTSSQGGRRRAARPRSPSDLRKRRGLARTNRWRALTAGARPDRARAVDYGKEVSRRPGAGGTEEIAISKFKATRLAALELERVRKTRRPIRVTKFGWRIAEAVPASSKPRGKHSLDSMAGTIGIEGNIVAPASDEKGREVVRS